MFASLYPNTTMQNNIAPHTQIGRVLINEKVHNKENVHNMDNWTRPGQYMEDIQSQVWIEFCSRWFHLADFTTLYNEVIEFFNRKFYPANGLYNRDIYGTIVVRNDEETIPDGMYFDPMEFFDEKFKKEIHESSDYRLPDLNKLEEFRNAAIANPNQQF